MSFSPTSCVISRVFILGCEFRIHSRASHGCCEVAMHSQKQPTNDHDENE